MSRPDPGGLDEHLDAILIGGREPKTIEIVDYSATWTERFQSESGRIKDVLGSRARSIEHIGSTAVPGLGAKPIVDIMITVDDPDDETVYLAPLEGLGYVLRVREAGHRMFRTPQRDLHVHIWPAGGDQERRLIAFRDWLRTHPSDRAAYERTKRSLAGDYTDMNYYARAKTDIIESILIKAQSELGES